MVNAELFEEPIDQWFRKKGFLVLIPGEAFEYRLYPNSSLFVWKDPGRWIVYRVSWYPDGKKKSETTKAETSTPAEAAKEAMSFIQWHESKKMKGKKSS